MPGRTSESGSPDAVPAACSETGRNWPDAIQAFAQALGRQDDWRQLLVEGLRQFIEVLQLAEAGAVYVHHRGPDRLLAVAAVGYGGGTLDKVRLKSGEGMVGRAFASGSSALYPDPEAVASVRRQASAPNRELLARLVPGQAHPQCAYCLPLFGTDAVFGALVLEHWQPGRAFSPSDLQLIEGLVSWLAVAADRLYQRTRLRSSQELVDQASELQMGIMSALSHDMRTPLASIKGYATALLLDEVEWSAEAAREYLEVIAEECDHLTEIIADLLETAMIDAGRLDIQGEPVLLARLSRAVVDEVARRSGAHRFVVQFAPGFPIVEADGGRIRRVLFNLLDNAVKYSPGGGLVVVRGTFTDDEVVVSVADQGEGIAPEHLNRLFERFFRVQFVNGRHVVGTGLGLPIARTIVELHGGHVWAESTLGEGSTFYFTLPRADWSEDANVARD